MPTGEGWDLEVIDYKPRWRESYDERPILSCVRPIVCHRSNTPFYAQCSTEKFGFCVRCHAVREGSLRKGSCCHVCSDRLTPQYHKWYPELSRLEPVEKVRTASVYKKYRSAFAKIGVLWRNDKELKAVMNNYMLLRVFTSDAGANLDALFLERTYMIGVFAGRRFDTCELARRLLRVGYGLDSHSVNFPPELHLSYVQRSRIVDELNERYFRGTSLCYWHSHLKNAEIWAAPSVFGKEHIATFKHLCARALEHVGAALPAMSRTPSYSDAKLASPASSVVSLPAVHLPHTPPAFSDLFGSCVIVCDFDTLLAAANFVFGPERGFEILVDLGVFDHFSQKQKPDTVGDGMQ